MTVQSNRSASLNLSGVDVPLLTKWIASLPVEAQKSGKLNVSVTPGDRPWDGESVNFQVTWHEDLAAGVGS